MIFEKPLMKPVVNWNMSKDRLMFVEEVRSTTFYLVKLFVDKKPVVYKFKLPDSINDERPAINPDQIEKKLNPLSKILITIKKGRGGES